MDPAGLQVMNSHLPFDPAADVRITHTVHQGRATDNQSSRGLILNHYLRGPSVGKGQHGTVYKCNDLTRDNVEVVRLSLPTRSFFLSPSLCARPSNFSSFSFFFFFGPPRPSRSCHDIILAPTASTSSRGKRSRGRGLTCLSLIISVAKSTKSKRR